MNQFRIDAVTDLQEAQLIVESNRLRGYASSVEQFSGMRWDGSDMGGGVNILEQPDRPAFLVVGRK